MHEGAMTLKNTEEVPCLLKESCLFKQSGAWNPDMALTNKERKILFWGIGSSLCFFLLMVGVYTFFMLYPFKTLTFTQPIEILSDRFVNGQKAVKVGDSVEMKIFYHKYTNAPGLIIRTLIRRQGKEIIVIDSSAAVSNRKAGCGTTYSLFPIPNHPLAVGPDCRVLFSIYYHIYGRTVLRQFETEPFSITR